MNDPKSHAQFADAVRQTDSTELFTLARQVRELIGTPGWDAIARLVEGQRQRLNGRITNPSLPSYEALASLTGEIRGLNAFEQAAETVLAIAVEREDELNRSLAESS